MTDEEKLAFLKDVLKENGLDFNAQEINDFFTEKRKKSETLTRRDESKMLVKYGHSSLIRPDIKKITPMEVENASYADTHNIETILDWFLYRNSGDNPLVFENLRNEKFDIFQSFIDENVKYPFNQDLDGDIFNGDSGNHRLLTLIIKNFIEHSKAKNVEEQELVEKEFGMVVFVNLPHREELCDALSDRYYSVSDLYTKDKDRIYPRKACGYREDSFIKAGEEDYLVEYDPETKKYSYKFNFDTFVGTDEELIGYLAVHKVSPEPIMTWCAGGIYYLSCNNQVWKSSSKEEIDKLVPQIQKWHKEGKSTLNCYLEVKDIDSQTYEFSYPGAYIEDERIAKAYAEFWGLILKGRPEKTLFNKLKNFDLVEKELVRSVEKSKSFSLPYFEYENLTKNEYVNIKALFDQFEKFKQSIKTDNVEV